MPTKGASRKRSRGASDDEDGEGSRGSRGQAIKVMEARVANLIAEVAGLKGELDAERRAHIKLASVGVALRAQLKKKGALGGSDRPVEAAAQGSEAARPGPMLKSASTVIRSCSSGRQPLPAPPGATADAALPLPTASHSGGGAGGCNLRAFLAGPHTQELDQLSVGATPCSGARDAAAEPDAERQAQAAAGRCAGASGHEADGGEAELVASLVPPYMWEGLDMRFLTCPLDGPDPYPAAGAELLATDLAAGSTTGSPALVDPGSAAPPAAAPPPASPPPRPDPTHDAFLGDGPGWTGAAGPAGASGPVSESSDGGGCAAAWVPQLVAVSTVRRRRASSLPPAVPTAAAEAAPGLPPVSYMLLGNPLLSSAGSSGSTDLPAAGPSLQACAAPPAAGVGAGTGSASPGYAAARPPGADPLAFSLLTYGAAAGLPTQPEPVRRRTEAETLAVVPSRPLPCPRELSDAVVGSLDAPTQQLQQQQQLQLPQPGLFRSLSSFTSSNYARTAPASAEELLPYGKSFTSGPWPGLSAVQDLRVSEQLDAPAPAPPEDPCALQRPACSLDVRTPARQEHVPRGGLAGACALAAQVHASGGAIAPCIAAAAPCGSEDVGAAAGWRRGMETDGSSERLPMPSPVLQRGAVPWPPPYPSPYVAWAPYASPYTTPYAGHPSRPGQWSRPPARVPPPLPRAAAAAPPASAYLGTFPAPGDAAATAQVYPATPTKPHMPSGMPAYGMWPWCPS